MSESKEKKTLTEEEKQVVIDKCNINVLHPLGLGLVARGDGLYKLVETDAPEGFYLSTEEAEQTGDRFREIFVSKMSNQKARINILGGSLQTSATGVYVEEGNFPPAETVDLGIGTETDVEGSKEEVTPKSKKTAPKKRAPAKKKK